MKSSVARWTAAVVLLTASASGVSARQTTPRPVVILQGFVRNETTGDPIAGVRIDHAHRAASAMSDANGWYRLELPDQGVVTASATRPGFLPETRSQQSPCDGWVFEPGQVPSCEVEFDFELRPFVPTESVSATCGLWGTVSNRESGTPIANATVEIDGTGIGTVTQDDGRYTFPFVPSGLHRVTARAIGMIKLSRLVAVACVTPREGSPLPMKLSPLAIL